MLERIVVDDAGSALAEISPDVLIRTRLIAP